MTQYDNIHRAGLFILKANGVSHALPAHEVLEWLQLHSDTGVELLRIHRVHEDGSLDLVGVSPDLLRIRDAMLFVEQDVRAARRDYNALVDASRSALPPCRIELSLSHASDNDAAHVVALTFPRACVESVGQWLTQIAFDTSARVENSPARLADFEAAVTQVILRATLEPT